MPKTKTNPTRKDKLNKYKESHKQKSMAQQLPQPEPVRQVPIWKSNQTIDMNGLEFEAIFNFINGVQGAYGAIQSIMNRNIINGAIQIGFEKINEDQTAYVPMTEEEQAPHKEQFDKMLEGLKAQAARMVRREDQHLEPITAEEQENLPHIDALVDVDGNPISSES